MIDRRGILMANAYSGGGESITFPQPSKIVTISPTDETVDLSDMLIESGGAINGIRIDGNGIPATNLVNDYSCLFFRVTLSSSGVPRLFAVSNNAFYNASNATYYAAWDNTTKTISLKTYGKKAMRGTWLFYQTNPA